MAEWMTSVWKDAVTHWNREQREQAGDVCKQASQWLKDYKEALERPDQKVFFNCMYRGPMLFASFAESIFHSSQMACAALHLDMHIACAQFLKPFHHFFEQGMKQFQQSFGPITGMKAAPVPNSEELLQQYYAYMKCMQKLHQLIKGALLKSADEMAELLAQKSEEGSTMDYQEFFNEWSAVNEKAFAEVYESDAFKELQQECEKIHKALMDQWDRMMLFMPFPFVLKTQLDTIRQTDEGLEKRIADLEKHLQNQK